MDEFEYSKHTLDMMLEREIQESWISDAIKAPDYTEFVSNKELHFIK